MTTIDESNAKEQDNQQENIEPVVQSETQAQEEVTLRERLFDMALDLMDNYQDFQQPTQSTDNTEPLRQIILPCIQSSSTNTNQLITVIQSSMEQYSDDELFY